MSKNPQFKKPHQQQQKGLEEVREPASKQLGEGLQDREVLQDRNEEPESSKEEPKPSIAAQAPPKKDPVVTLDPEKTGAIPTSISQNEFLNPLLVKYNEKVNALVKAHQEVAEIASTIYDFSTVIVAGEKGLKGQWFAAQAGLVVRRDHPSAQQLHNLVWPVLGRK